MAMGSGLFELKLVGVGLLTCIWAGRLARVCKGRLAIAYMRICFGL